MTNTALVYIAAAIAEIAGCFGIWLWLRHEKSIWLVPASVASLAVFAVLLTMVEANSGHEGRPSRNRWQADSQSPKSVSTGANPPPSVRKLVVCPW